MTELLPSIQISTELTPRSGGALVHKYMVKEMSNRVTKSPNLPGTLKKITISIFFTQLRAFQESKPTISGLTKNDSNAT